MIGQMISLALALLGFAVVALAAALVRSAQ